MKLQECGENFIMRRLLIRPLHQMLSGCQVAFMGEIGNAYRLWPHNMEGKVHLENLCIGRRIILKWILK
jgi:hypothetical protein